MATEKSPQNTDKKLAAVKDFTAEMPSHVAKALENIAESAFNYYEVREQEITKRKKLEDEKEVILSRIDKSRKNIKDYFDAKFGERERCLTQLFKQLDKSTDDKEYEFATEVLKIISRVIRDDPIDVGVLESLREGNRYDKGSSSEKKVIDI